MLDINNPGDEIAYNTSKTVWSWGNHKLVSVQGEIVLSDL